MKLFKILFVERGLKVYLNSSNPDRDSIPGENNAINRSIDCEIVMFSNTFFNRRIFFIGGKGFR